MSYVCFLAALPVLLLFIFLREAAAAVKREKAFEKALYDNFGKKPRKRTNTDPSKHIAGYLNRHRKEGMLDDITWNDLGMEQVFERMDYALSDTGEEYLYYLLHDISEDEEKCRKLDELSRFFEENPKARVALQLLFRRLGKNGKYSLYDYLENLEQLQNKSNIKHFLADILYLVLVVWAPFYLMPAVIGISALGIFQIITYFKDKREMEPYITSFSYIVRLITVSERITDLTIPACNAVFQKMQRCTDAMRGIKRGAFWVFTASDSRTSGNPLEVLLDYLRMIFHVDLMIFNRMVRQLKNHTGEADELIACNGFLESAVCVSSFRASLKEGWCVPDFQKEKKSLTIEEGYHPLIDRPVKNTVNAQRGVLVTGSNASGKSTFLKMTAVNAVMAQTIATCAAKRYSAPFFQIYSSMSHRDDLAHGESYYMVEIRALKRILDARGQGAPILCFVDEVLRGTNTVERIAASTQILKSLSGEDVLCFAATHDMELAETVRDGYDNYHFAEEIQNGDIVFPYRLNAGKATGRNAILLLELMGYDAQITGLAFQMAERFEKDGIWTT